MKAEYLRIFKRGAYTCLNVPSQHLLFDTEGTLSQNIT
jgi:hypothetical protein